jgi:hypothetical protein
MRYEELRAYTGTRHACCHCKRKFRIGQMLHVDRKHDLTFCDSDSDGPNLCLQNYLYLTFCEEHPNEGLAADLMVYREHVAREAVPEVVPPPTLLGRIKRFFGGA